MYFLPVGARVVNASCIGKESQYDTFQDHIRITCAKKKNHWNKLLYFTSFVHKTAMQLVAKAEPSL